MPSTDIATALLQTTGLLLPVVFLSMRFVRVNAGKEMRQKDLAPFILVFIAMIVFLTIAGLSSSLVLVGWGNSPAFADIGAAALLFFFLIFSYYIYLVVKAVDDSVKANW